MRLFFTIFLICSLAASGECYAQSRSAAPVIIYGEDVRPTSAPTTSSDVALGEFGQSSMGETVTKPDAAPVAPQAVAPSASPSAKAPINPPSPASPANPVDKLWPRNSIQLFLPSCTGLKPQFVVPCTCIITKLMVAMPHDEFLKKSEDGTLEQDPRLVTIRNQCVADALPKKE